jgi:hypothetical protein
MDRDEEGRREIKLEEKGGSVQLVAQCNGTRSTPWVIFWWFCAETLRQPRTQWKRVEFRARLG